MKFLGVSLLMVSLVLTTIPTVSAQETVELVVSGHDDDGFYFTIEGYTGKNPTVTIAPGASVTVRYTSVTGVHNFHAGDLGKTDIVDPSGGEQTFTFTAPASGSQEYWCDPHKASGMKGMLNFGTASNGDDDDDAGSNESPAFAPVAALLAIAGVALIARRRS